MNGAQEFVCLLALPVSIVVNAISNEQNDDRNNEQELKSTQKKPLRSFSLGSEQRTRNGGKERERGEREKG